MRNSSKNEDVADRIMLIIFEIEEMRIVLLKINIYLFIFK